MNRDPELRLLTVGHSHHDLPRFLDLLRAAGVTAVADVRSSPFSQRLPQFNRPELERALRPHAIAYVYLGDLLGGRPAGPDLYDEEGRVVYERVRATEPFHRGLDRVAEGMEGYTIALLCAEEDPLDCHRGLMIAPALVERDIRPGHLRRDGTVESTTAMEDRLLERHAAEADVAINSLFPPSEQERRALLAEAYRRQARRKAFQFKPGQLAQFLPRESESDLVE